ncbi:ribonuclease H-like domain-containing protein [Tanacetum coccineum]
MDDYPISQGNVLVFQNVTFDSSSRTELDSPEVVSTRRSSRMSKLPEKLNDFVLDNKIKYGLNSPIVKMSTVRCFTNMVVQNSWDLFQMDVNNAFLYGDLTEESKNDHSLFVKNKDGLFLAPLVYMDDIVIRRNNVGEISKFKDFLNQKFKIKDLGELKYFLGIEVLKMKNGLSLNKIRYCIELLHEYGLLACKPVATLMLENDVLPHKETDNDKPDIAYIVNCLSQHMHYPLQSHFEVALRVLRYLKSAPGAGIVYTKSSSRSINAYADSDWVKCKMNRRSLLEYRSMASTTCEVMWIVKILKY